MDCANSRLKTDVAALATSCSMVNCCYLSVKLQLWSYRVRSVLPTIITVWLSIAIFRARTTVACCIFHSSPCTLQVQKQRSCRCSTPPRSTDPPCPACRVPCKRTLSSSPSISRASG
uniref:Uncharacterized protein n=1 Tax=Setaria viridis TaxID=4556 RepID=A0A4U6U007_SETVI|nr:hypothetical protein SEVIR_7G018005v2 [Setaria viridis]